MQKRNLRITAKFDPIIAEQIRATTNQNNPALTDALIIDDAANLAHEIKIEYDSDNDGNVYRRLTYRMTSMINMKLVLEKQNKAAQELLYKIATALTGSTLFTLDVENNRYVNRNFDKSMFILGPNDGTWDDELPNDKPEPKRKRKQKQETNTNESDKGDKNE